MKFLNTDVWRLNVPVFLSAQDRMPVSLALSIAAEIGAVVKDRVLVSGSIWNRSRLRRGKDRSMG
jgi:xanthine/CO dehydrogenase XdhC/CoxF family maturation factor